MSLRLAPIRRNSNTSSECSNDSNRTKSTAPTVYSVKPSLRHFDTDISQLKATKEWAESFACAPQDPRSSAVSYASTIASEEDIDEQDFAYEEPPDYHYEAYTPTAYSSTPQEFAEYFPSTRRLCLHHDDTIDGNMNLRVDTEARTGSGRKVDLTLFHLRMHDLKTRDFSLRRYCRDSGREVCHSSRKYTKPASRKRPAFQRSVSNAFASLRPKTGDKSVKSLTRQDSGYESMKDLDHIDHTDDSLHSATKNLPIPTNTTMLEFSNYAHVELKRRGAKSSKRYEFEYWGTSYFWRRSVRKCGSTKEISYHLFASKSNDAVAHIVPEPMSPHEQEEEERKGGWVPPSSMWISDPKVINAQSDIAE